MTKAYCVKPNFNYEALRDLGIDQLVFLTDGLSTEPGLVQRNMSERLEHFEPQDLVVPAGSALHNLMVGFLLGQRMSSLRVAVYNDKGYTVMHLSNEVVETYMEPAHGG